MIKFVRFFHDKFEEYLRSLSSLLRLESLQRPFSLPLAKVSVNVRAADVGPHPQGVAKPGRSALACNEHQSQTLKIRRELQ